jgi:hypothetical protein
MALPALADIRRADPDARLTVAARPGLAPLFTLVPGIDETLALDSSRRLRGPQGDIARLRGGGFDRAVLFPNAFRWWSGKGSASLTDGVLLRWIIQDRAVDTSGASASARSITPPAVATLVRPRAKLVS